MTNDVLNTVLKLGAVGLGLIVASGILFLVYHFVRVILPVAVALNPGAKHGGTNGGGQLFTILQSVSAIGSELKILSAEISTFTKAVEERMTTKGEMMAEFATNRALIQGVLQERRAGQRRRGTRVGSRDRRKK